MINVKNVIFFIYYLKTMWYKSNESVDSTKQDIETNGNSPTAIMLIFCPIGGHNILNRSICYKFREYYDSANRIDLKVLTFW